jgi:hypothetical protein
VHAQKYEQPRTDPRYLLAVDVDPGRRDSLNHRPHPAYIPSIAAVDVVNEYLESLPGGCRRLAHAEWGLTLSAESTGGWPCDIGIRIDDELLKVQAFALPAQDDVDPAVLLQWNRQTRIVRMALTRSGDVWVLGDIPVRAVDEQGVDRLMGLVAEGVLAVRGYAKALAEPPAAPSGWLNAP